MSLFGILTGRGLVILLGFPIPFLIVSLSHYHHLHSLVGRVVDHRQDKCQIITDDQLYVDKVNSSPAYLGLSRQCSTAVFYQYLLREVVCFVNVNGFPESRRKNMT